MTFNNEIKLTDIFIITALIIGPILAVQVQKLIESFKEKYNQKLFIFRTLMATRASRLSALHVEALNMIDIVFYGTEEKDTFVTNKWKIYLDHFSECPQDLKDPNYQTKISSWTEKGDDLFVDLLEVMSNNLGFRFDRVHLKKGCYSPKGHADVESDQMFLRKGMVEVLSGKRNIPIAVVNYPINDQKEKS